MVSLKLASPLDPLSRWTTMVPQAWSWRAGDLKHAIGCTGFCSHCFNHCKCKEASKTALAGCQPLKSLSQAVQGEYVDCRTVAWQDEDSFQASMIFDDFRVWQSFALCNHAVGQGQMVTNSGKLGAELMRLSRDGFSLQSILFGQRESNKPTLQQMTAKSRRKVTETEDPRKYRCVLYIGYRLLAEGSNWKRSADHWATQHIKPCNEVSPRHSATFWLATYPGESIPGPEASHAFPSTVKIAGWTWVVFLFCIWFFNEDAILFSIS